MDRLIEQEYEAMVEAPESSGPFPRYVNGSFPLLAKPHIVIHLPKTGGTTWGILARRNEDLYRFRQFWYFIQRNELPYISRCKQGTLFGHFRYGVHFWYPNSTFNYVSMLREPVDRVLSHYFYHKTEPRDPGHRLALEMSLEEWINKSKNAHNRMTAFLSGMVYQEQNEHTLDLAKAHLERFGFVGLTEKFDQSVVMMKYFLGWKRLRYFVRKQTREKPHRHDIPESTIALIREYNKYDVELYDLAKELFDKQLTALETSGVDLQKEVDDYIRSKHL